MFVKALRQVEQFTQPVIISTRYYSGEVVAGCGAFVIINKEGCILTASHIMEQLIVSQQHKMEMAEYNKENARLQNDRSLSAKQRNRKLAKLRTNPRWITNISHWWGRDGVTIRDVAGDKLRDIAIARLEPFDPMWFKCYPTFWNPDTELSIGTSLCRLGFPFHDVKSTFDADTGHFSLAPGTIPVPRFPLDGIHTRVAVFRDAQSGRKAEFIEISTPGLRGQSGGPIFDVSGRICGIQSRTHHLPLGFSPEVKRGGKKVIEHQFLNVGIGIHAKEIIAFLKEHDISFTIAPRTETNGE